MNAGLASVRWVIFFSQRREVGPAQRDFANSQINSKGERQKTNARILVSKDEKFAQTWLLHICSLFQYLKDGQYGGRCTNLFTETIRRDTDLKRAFCLSARNIMDASKELLLVGIELLKRGDSNFDSFGRITRLTGHALFALGRAGSKTFIEPEINCEWLEASGNFERDGLSQILLRDKVVELKYTKVEHFKAVFQGKSSLLLFKSAREFFREVRHHRLERDRIACAALGLACLLLAEDRYSLQTRSLQECLEQKSAIKEILINQDEFFNFISLTGMFIDIRQQLAGSFSDSTGKVLSSHLNPDSTESITAINH